jgi:hypothetical protein
MVYCCYYYNACLLYDYLVLHARGGGGSMDVHVQIPIPYLECAMILWCGWAGKAVLLACHVYYYSACVHAQQGVKQSVCVSICLSVVCR